MNGNGWRTRRHSTMRGIRGATDAASVTPRPRTIGHLRKGITEERISKSGKKYMAPVDLTYFRFTSDDPKIMALFLKTYGEEPRLINAILPYPTADECFQTCMEEWVASGLRHRCDGVEMTLWRDDKGTHTAPPADPRPCPYYNHPELRTVADKAKGIPANPGCRWVGRLVVMIPELLRAGYTGLVILTETSKNDILELQRNLHDLEDRRRREGATLEPLLYFPVTLRRVEREVSCPDEGNGRARRRKWLVEIEPTVEWMKRQLSAARAEILPQLTTPAQLPDWEDATSDGRPVAVIEAEFAEVADAPGFAEEEPAESAADADLPLEPPAPLSREEQARALWGRLWQRALQEGWQESNRLLLEKMGYGGLLQVLDFAADRGEVAITGQMLDIVRPWPEEVIAAGLQMGRWPDRAAVCAALHESGFFRDTLPDVLIDWLSSMSRQESADGEQLALPLEVPA